jgi:hypothetical protein
MDAGRHELEDFWLFQEGAEGSGLVDELRSKLGAPILHTSAR